MASMIGHPRRVDGARCVAVFIARSFSGFQYESKIAWISRAF
jgi:hypothetical protein